MTDRPKELAKRMRETLRDGGLMPAYTDESKGPHPQPPVMQSLLEEAIIQHVEPILAVKNNEIGKLNAEIAELRPALDHLRTLVRVYERSAGDGAVMVAAFKAAEDFLNECQ